MHYENDTTYMYLRFRLFTAAKVCTTYKSRQIPTRVHCVPSRKRYYYYYYVLGRCNSGADEDLRLLECYTVSKGNQLWTFRSNVVPPSSGPNSPRRGITVLTTEAFALLGCCAA